MSSDNRRSHFQLLLGSDQSFCHPGLGGAGPVHISTKGSLVILDRYRARLEASNTLSLRHGASIAAGSIIFNSMALLPDLAEVSWVQVPDP